MNKTMVALIAVSIAAVLLGYGCRDKAATQTGVTPVADSMAVAVPVSDASLNIPPPVAATPDTTGPGAGGGQMYAELANPQSDDQGCYVPVARDSNYSLVGYASGKRPVAQVMVNDVEADTFAANYQPYGAPSGFAPIGFRVPLTLSNDSLITVSMIDADGYRETMIFHPERERAYDRVHELWQGSQNDPYANVRMANTFVAMGDYPDAYTRYHRCIGLDVGFVWGPFFMGVALYNDNRYDDAEWQFRHCGRMDSGFYLANYQIGQIYERRGNYGYANLEYQAVIGVSPMFVAAQWSLGESYAQQGNWGGATRQYRQALQYNPQFARAHQGLGESLAHQGQWAASATSLRTAASINPRDARTQADLSATMRHQQRSPQQYRVALAPLSAPRGSEQVAARNVQYTRGGQAYQAVAAQQLTRPSAAQQSRLSVRQQARTSVTQTARVAGGQPTRASVTPTVARPAARQHEAQPKVTPIAKPVARQHEAQPKVIPTAKPAAREQAKPSGGETDQKDKGKGR